MLWGLSQLSLENFISLTSRNLYILDLLMARPVNNLEINTETLITVAGFLGAILLLLDVVVVK